MADVCSSSVQSSRTQVGTTHLYVLKVSLRREYCSFLRGSKTLKSKKTFQARRLLWCPVYKAASTSWMNNLLTLANRSTRDSLQLGYNVLFNLVKVTRFYIFCIFFNLVMIAKFLPDWILVNINLSITFLQRQVSIIEEIPKIHHQ